ncbi:MAG: hypothetical protein IRY98_04940 [Alicyclobacillaceae bacterium]|nr:hypothetical protein [Alicyclobacillaceae bacterium]
MENHREGQGSDGVRRWGTAVALAFVLLQAWIMWSKGPHARDPYREPRGPSIKVGAVESTEFSWDYVWQRLQEFYRTGE